jgi:glutaredoxin
MRVFFAMVLLLVLQPAQADDLYRWVDKNGKVHYGDTPPDEDAEQLNLKAFGSPAASSVDDSSLPYETRHAKQNFPVTLYVAESCTTACQQARDFLSKHHIPYSETTLKTKEEFDAFQKKSGSDSVPTISIGNTWLKGFQSKQWQDELDAAGYPK